MSDTPAVLVPMAEPEFQAYRAFSAVNYANEKMRAEGLTAEEAAAAAERSLSTLLPDGVRSEGQFMYTICDADSGARVGMVWFALKVRGAEPYAWIYDIVVDEDQRGKGYGEAALSLIEVEARARGASRMELHVFGHNVGAQRLYERVGYRPTNITMRKDLG